MIPVSFARPAEGMVASSIETGGARFVAAHIGITAPAYEAPSFVPRNVEPRI